MIKKSYNISCLSKKLIKIQILRDDMALDYIVIVGMIK